MNYVMYYDYDNLDSAYEGVPAVRHGAAFCLFDCIVKFQKLNDEEVIFWVDGNKHSKEEAEAIFQKVSKLLSYLFALPFYSKENRCFDVDWKLEENDLLSKKSMKKMTLLEKQINKFNKTSGFFYENLELLCVAIENFFRGRDEDAFVYFFKVVERIAKQYYVVYMQRHHTKAATSKNKRDLRDLIKNYAVDNLQVNLTEDMLDRKVDLLYKELKLQFYGSVFNKISLFVSKENVNISIDVISEIVKLRNKVAHGDVVDNQKLQDGLGRCEYLAMQMFSKCYFRKTYEELHLTSYRIFDKIDPYE